MVTIRIVFLLFIWVGFSTKSVYSQTEPRQLVEFIIAVMGDEVILRGEFEMEMAQIAQSGEMITDDLKCFVLKELMERKLLVHQAKIDSVGVSDERLDDELNRRIKMFAGQVGGEKELERYLGKSISEYKREAKPKLKQQMLAQEMEQTILHNVKVSPSEIREFFEKIPADSLPFIKDQVVLGQIIIQPKPSASAKAFARDEITRMREDIVRGRSDFQTMAQMYSDDPGSGQMGGRLGEFGRGEMVPEFERAVFKLQAGEISPVFETKYGYHIVQLIERRGEKVDARHILVMPKSTSYEVRNARTLADSIKLAFDNNEAEFCEYVKAFSDDEMTKGNCGLLFNPQTGSNRIPLELLDPKTLSLINGLGPNQMAAPEVIEMPDGGKAVRLLYVKSKHDAHIANLKDDYTQIQMAALENKRDEVLREWILKKIKNTYFFVNRNFIDCAFESEWQRLLEN